MSDHLRRERDDLHKPLVAQLAPHRPEDAGRAGLALIGDEHGGVLIEPDVGAVLALGLLGRAHDHRPHHLALLDLAGGNGILDRHDHDEDRKSTRLNSSHSQISYAVFCLKKKTREYTK